MSVSDSDEFLSAEEDNSITATDQPENAHTTQLDKVVTPASDIIHSNEQTLVGEQILSHSDKPSILVTEENYGMSPVESDVCYSDVHESVIEPTVTEKPDNMMEKSGHIASNGPVEISSTQTIADNTDYMPNDTDLIESTPPVDDVRSVSDPAELEAVRLEVLAGKEAGNSLFRDGDFTSSLDSYSSALKLCPRELPSERAVLFSNRAICHLRLEQDQLALSDCTHSLDIDPLYLKARLRRAQLHEKLGKLEEALTDFSELLKSDPNSSQAREAVPRLTTAVEAQRESMKTEAISKLKELGDMVLKPFGISTSDFNFVQDPNTGSYSVSFGNKS